MQEGSAPGSEKGYKYILLMSFGLIDPRYFGAAKNLPGVKELLEKKPQPKKAKYDYRGIDVGYYGYRDEEELTLVQLEEEASKKGNLISNYP